MIACSEGAIQSHTPGQQTTCQRQSHNNAHISRGSSREQAFGRILPKQVEEHLKAGKLGMFERKQCFINHFDTGAKLSDQPLLLKVFHPAKNFSVKQNLSGHTVQLREIDTLDTEALSRALQSLLDCRFSVTIRIELSITSNFGSDQRRLCLLLEPLTNT